MDLAEAMLKWEHIPGCKTAGWDAPDGCYYILFIGKDSQVKGYVKTIPGQGFQFKLPSFAEAQAV